MNHMTFLNDFNTRHISYLAEGISFAGPFRVSEALLLGITRTLLVGWVVGWLVGGPERFNPLPVGGSLPNLHGR